MKSIRVALCVLPLALLGLFASDAGARPRRGHDTAILSVRMDVDLDAGSVALRSGKPLLPGLVFEAGFVSQDPDAHTSTLEVRLRNDSDRTLVGNVEGEFVGGSKGLDPSGIWTIPSNALRLATVSNSAQWTVYHADLRTFRIRLRLRAGVPLLANEAAVLKGEGGTRVVVPEFAIPYEALVGIHPVTSDEFASDPGEMSVLGGVDVDLEPTVFHAAAPPPNKPLIVTMRAPKLAGGTDEYFLAMEVEAEQIAETEQQSAALVPQLLLAAHALRKGSRLVSSTDILPGVFHAGRYAFVRTTPRAWVRGAVRDSRGLRSGAIVRASGSPAIAVTGADGAYALAVPSVSSVVVTALDPLRGQRGVVGGGVAPPVNSLQLDVVVAQPPVSVVLRDGVQNGGFENDDLTGWNSIGSTSIHSAPVVCSVDTAFPIEGTSMASLSTASLDVLASSLVQTFRVPAGARSLAFDYNVLSSEFTTGAPAPDSFVATIVTPGGDFEVARLVVTDPIPAFSVGDCGDGEATAQTGWISASIDLSAWSGEPATQVQLVLSVASAVDALLPTTVLVDNFRFGTVWLDVKKLELSTSTFEQAVAMTRGANSVLRQTGLNLRLRGFTPTADPGGLSNLDITPTGSGACGADISRQDIDLTPEMSQVLGLGRSTFATDLNAWMVRSLDGAGAGVGAGYAVSEDDFCSAVSLLVNGGVFLVDGASGRALVHEAGHVLLSPQSAGSPLEHNAAPGNFMISNTPPLGVVTRAQAININRVGAPLVLP